MVKIGTIIKAKSRSWNKRYQIGAIGKVIDIVKDDNATVYEIEFYKGEYDKSRKNGCWYLARHNFTVVNSEIRINKKLQNLLEENNLIIKDYEIGLCDGEKYKYYVYHNSNFNFYFGANTQREVIERLS